MRGDNIRVMDPTRDGNVDATKDTFHSFIWKGKKILVRIDTDIRKYCINSLLKVWLIVPASCRGFETSKDHQRIIDSS